MTLTELPLSHAESEISVHANSQTFLGVNLDQGLLQISHGTWRFFLLPKLISAACKVIKSIML